MQTTVDNQQGRGLQHTQAYAYDRQSQLVAAQSANPSSPVTATSAAGDARVWRYHYDANGNRILAQENVPVAELGHTRKARFDPASHALIPPPDFDREYVWNAQGQLISIRQENRELARYRYNHHGLRVGKQTGAESTHTLYNDQRQRIADLDANGHITRQYLWLGDHLIATLDARQPKALHAPAEGFLAELIQVAQALWNSATGNTDRLAFVHVNHLGAPIAATNQAGQILWQADYAPYGQIIRMAAARKDKLAYTLALRLPGQWEDRESGLYYNDFRYYDPQSGRYVSPDPLGRLAEALGSPNAYAYVNNNPLSYIDPWGLILFAFDGTNNSNPPPGVDDFSNVYKFYQAYDDDRAWYMNGVGRPDPDSGIGTGPLYNALLDAGNGYTARDRVTYMLNQLDNYMQSTQIKKGDIVNIDIVGFSRGAAMARDFANKVAQRLRKDAYKNSGACVNLRFLGLWDTVAQFGANGAGNGLWQLAIPAEVKNVYQAVALNEHRYLFPGESIGRGVQRGFIGSHADIGGGFAEGDDSALAKVALAWMVDQAEAAGVKMKPFNETIIANSVIHDKSDAIRFGSPVAGSGFVNDGTWNPGYDIPADAAVGTGAEDRDVRYLDGTKTTQRKMTGTIMTYADTEQFITFDPTRSRPDNVTGTVDMKAYLAWLNTHGYGFTTKLKVE